MIMAENKNLVNDIEHWIKNNGDSRDSLMPVLQEIQNKFGWISEEAIDIITDKMQLTRADVAGVISFYKFLNREKKGKFIIRLDKCISGVMKGSKNIARFLESELGIKFGQTTKDLMFTLDWTNCTGMCDLGPAMMVNDHLYTDLTEERIKEILDYCRKDKSATDLAGKVPDTVIPCQIHGQISFSSAEIGAGLTKALSMTPAAIIAELSSSGLKGRGGAGFGTGLKWKLTHEAPGVEKWLICNADEGEPGTFKDRIILDTYPDLVFEGMTIAAYTIGAKKSILYLRGEYKYLLSKLETCLEKRRSKGLLGKNILGKQEFDHDINIHMGSGAYICGEETALIESLEGYRGEPRNRPPYPVTSGYRRQPSSVNNVETLAWVPLILCKGSPWFSGVGSDKSKGYKLLSVSGDCAFPGVHEMPMGISINDLLEKIGGKDAKAIQVGGYTGVCIPRSQFHRKIAFEDAATGGSIIVYGQNRDMLEVAETYLEFFIDESCGQCIPCRIGNIKLLEGIKMLRAKNISVEYLEILKNLGKTMKFSSKCGLGQTSPNIVEAILSYFLNDPL